MFNVNKIHMIYTHERAADVIQEKTKMIDGLYHFLGKMYWNYCSCNPIIKLRGASSRVQK